MLDNILKVYLTIRSWAQVVYSAISQQDAAELTITQRETGQVPVAWLFLIRHIKGWQSKAYNFIYF